MRRLVVWAMVEALTGWTPFGAEIKGETLPAEIGSRRIAVVDTGSVDQKAGAYVALLIGPPPTEPEPSHAAGDRAAIPWRKFSPATLKELRGKNKPVLVFCRADWDATCALLDRTLFADRRIIDLIKQREYIPLLADCTNRPDEELKGYLQEVGWHGNATIVVYRPEKEGRVVLQVNRTSRSVSVEDLLEALNSAPLTKDGG